MDLYIYTETLCIQQIASVGFFLTFSVPPPLYRKQKATTSSTFPFFCLALGASQRHQKLFVVGKIFSTFSVPPEFLPR